MGLFNHTLSRGDESLLFSYDDAFQIRKSIVLPNEKCDIRIGGTASAGGLIIHTGTAINIDADFSNGVHVLTVDNNIIDCLKIGDIRIGDIVYAYEHMSLQQSNFGQFNFVASKVLPVFINLHSINIDYVGMYKIYIDPHIGYINDENRNTICH